MVNTIIKILGTIILITLLPACASMSSDPRQAVAATWLKSGDPGHDCPPVWAATSPMRDDLKISEPEFDFTGDDGAKRWQVRSTGEGYDRLVIVTETLDGKLCVSTDSTLR